MPALWGGRVLTNGWKIRETFIFGEGRLAGYAKQAGGNTTEGVLAWQRTAAWVRAYRRA